MKELKPAAQLEPAAAHALHELIDYAPGSIVSRAFKQAKVGSLTLFAFDEGQSLNEHTAPYDAFVQIVEGEAELTIGGENITAVAGELVLMPAEIPHAVYASTRFKMLLTMIRG